MHHNGDAGREGREGGKGGREGREGGRGGREEKVNQLHGYLVKTTHLLGVDVSFSLGVSSQYSG